MRLRHGREIGSVLHGQRHVVERDGGEGKLIKPSACIWEREFTRFEMVNRPNDWNSGHFASSLGY